MKKIIKSLLIFAAATTAFASCSKADINESVAPETPATLMAVEATAYAPEETRVNMGDKEGETYPMTWDDTTESFKVVEIYDSNAAACSMVEDSYKNNDGTASFQFNVDASHKADTYKYYAISPVPATNATQDKAYFHVTIPAAQTQTDKVDPAAIVLVGTADECTEQGNGGALEFDFQHITAYAKMTVKGVELEDGQTVDKVSFTATADIAGPLYQYRLDGSNNKFGNGSGKTITVSGLNVDAKAAAAGFDVWFGTAPLENITEFTVEVFAKDVKLPIAAKAVETGDKKPLAFTSGRVSAFSVTVEAASEGDDNNEIYKQVTSLADITEGEYIFVAGDYTIENASTSKAPAATLVSNAYFTLDGEKITGVVNKYTWTLTGTSTAMLIQSTAEAGNYLACSVKNNNNCIRINNTQSTWKFETSSNGCFHLVVKDPNDNSTDRYLSVYPSTPDWRAYKDTNNSGASAISEIRVFKKVGDSNEPSEPSAPVLTITETTISADDGLGIVHYSITNPIEGAEITATTDAKWIDTDLDTTTEGEIQFLVEENTDAEAREGKITFHYPNAADQTVTVKQAGVGGDGEEDPYVGKWVLAIKTGNTYYAVSSTMTSDRFDPVDLKWSSIPASYDGANSEIVWEIKSSETEGKYYIMYEGNYMQAHSSNNKAALNTTKADITITPNSGDNTVTIQCDAKNLWSNQSNNNVFGFSSTAGNKSNFYLIPVESTTGGGNGEEEGGDQPTTPTENTVSFKFPEIYSSVTTSQTIDNTNITEQDITLLFTKGGTATQYYANGSAVRWYSGGTFTVSGGTITKVVVNYSQTANSVSADTGSYSLSNNVGTWTGNASTVKFTQSGSSGHCRITSIDVTYTK